MGVAVAGVAGAAAAVALAAWWFEGRGQADVAGWPLDAIVIAGVVVLNAVLGWLQEAKAAQAVAALAKMTTATSAVLRDGAVTRVPSAELVKGDVLVLAEGDAVGADARLASTRSLVEHFGHEKGEFQRLFGVEARVAVGVIAIAQPFLGDRHRPADTLGHVLPGHLDMDAAGVRAFGAVDGEEALHFARDAVKRAGLEAGVGLHDIAVHRIAAPHHRMAFALHRAHQLGQAVLDLVMAEPADERDAPRLALGVQFIEQCQQRVRLQRRAALHAERIADPAREFDMRAAGEAGAIADPQHVRAGGVPVAGERVAPRQCLFVG